MDPNLILFYCTGLMALVALVAMVVAHRAIRSTERATATATRSRDAYNALRGRWLAGERPGSFDEHAARAVQLARWRHPEQRPLRAVRPGADATQVLDSVRDMP